MENKNKKFKSYFPQTKVIAFATIMTCMAGLLSIIGLFHANKTSVDTQKKIESTLTYKDVDSTVVRKLINDVNEMYKYNERLSDSIDALNLELDTCRKRLGIETSIQIKKELLAKRKAENEAREEAVKKREEELMAQMKETEKAMEEASKKREEELMAQIKAAEKAKEEAVKKREEELMAQMKATEWARNDAAKKREEELMARIKAMEEAMRAFNNKRDQLKIRMQATEKDMKDAAKKQEELKAQKQETEMAREEATKNERKN